MTNKDVMNVAMEWVVAMRTSADAESLRPELDAWLLENPRHRMAYERADRQWSSFDKAVSLLQEGSPRSPDALFSEIDDVEREFNRRRRLKSYTKVSAIAIAALGACVLIVFAIRPPKAPSVAVAWVQYTDADKSPESHVLADGSELILDDHSVAKVRMTSVSREITLDRGELLVRVKHDDRRAFLVHAGEVVLRAVGTEFSVSRDAKGNLETTVREGTVKITPKAASAAPRSSEQETIVDAGQTATISGGKVQVESRDPAEIENRLAWVQDRVYLHGTLSQAVAQFNEHNDDKLVIADPVIGNLNVAGLYDRHDLFEFAKSLRPRGVRYEVKKAAGARNQTIVLSAVK